MDPLTIMTLGGMGANIAGLFDGSEVEGAGFEAIPSSDSQDAARDYLKSLYKTPVRYPTQEIAGMSENERFGQDILRQLLMEGPSEQRGAALDYLTGILDQPADVTELPEIKALMSSIEDQTSDLVNSAMRRTQLSGMGTSGPQGSAVGRELSKGKTSMVAALAPYMSKARSDRLTASQLINSLVSGEEGSMLNKIGAANAYGSLPRQLEQAGKDAQYNKLVNDILAKYQLNAPVAQSIMNEQRYMYDPGTVQPSIFSQIGQAMPGMMMGYHLMNQGGGGYTQPAGQSLSSSGLPYLSNQDLPNPLKP